PDINNILIAGNLTGDPVLRETSNGTPVANFYIAANRKFKDNTGQWRENVCFVGVVAWYKLAESCFEYLKKGAAVMVEGELQSRNWKNEDGSNNNVVEIKARRIQFLNRQNKKDESFLFEPVTEVTSEVESDIPASANVKNIEVVSTDEDKIRKQWFEF
ncbi:single-stranded DNA-binding protein, partial [candidate division KSB1 bacterium]|nr:single-stranded DNA-binding protein [candidate division KSB1 bacterium]